jgi:hypothetical protein
MKDTDNQGYFTTIENAKAIEKTKDDLCFVYWCCILIVILFVQLEINRWFHFLSAFPNLLSSDMV